MTRLTLPRTDLFVASCTGGNQRAGATSSPCTTVRVSIGRAGTSSFRGGEYVGRRGVDFAAIPDALTV